VGLLEGSRRDHDRGLMASRVVSNRAHRFVRICEKRRSCGRFGSRAARDLASSDRRRSRKLRKGAQGCCHSNRDHRRRRIGVELKFAATRLQSVARPKRGAGYGSTSDTTVGARPTDLLNQPRCHKTVRTRLTRPLRSRSVYELRVRIDGDDFRACSTSEFPVGEAKLGTVEKALRHCQGTREDA